MSRETSMQTRYRTIVADPPWPHENSHAGTYPGPAYKQVDMPYPTMSVQEIEHLPVRSLAETDSHLYLWTTQRYLEAGLQTVRSWGFSLSAVLVWSKAPKGIGGGAFIPSAEFVLFARRGRLPHRRRQLGTVFQWPRGKHSQKPEHFYDMVEQISAPPYVELFARHHRLGWDVWGNESANTAVLDSA
jgi:N6-adenosine-specific RNA methylase IME4